jgi:hypothetical protein
MDSLNFWLHMDNEFMWRWYCYNADRDIVARSAEWYFSCDEAKAAVQAAKARMIQVAAA